MGIPWGEFVRQYAKDNNTPYGFAISEAGVAYRSKKQVEILNQKKKNEE